MDKITVNDINVDKFNPFGASSEELVANALEEAGLVKETTEINELGAKTVCNSYYNKRENYRELTKLGNMLIKKNIITSEELEKALQYQKQNPEVKIGNILMELDLCTQEDVNLSINVQVQVRDGIQELDICKSKISVIKERLKNLLAENS